MRQGQEPVGPSWTQRVHQVILQVVQHDLARAHFNQPGPAGPMCFAAILQRLMEGGYARPTDVHQDVQRIWAQCRAVAPPGSEMSRACDRLAPLVDMLWHHCQLEMAPTPSPPAVQQQHGQQQQLSPPQLSPTGMQHEAQQQQQPTLKPALQQGGWEQLGPPGMVPAAGWGSPAQPLPSMVVQQQPLNGLGPGTVAAQEQHLALAHMRQAESQLALAQQQQAQLALARQHAAVLARQQQASPLSASGGSAAPDAQQQQQQLAMAQQLEQQERDQRRIALLRLRHDLMGEQGVEQQLQQQPQQLAGPVSRQPSTLAEQQQAWLDAMAQQRKPPPVQQAAGELAHSDAQRLATLLLQGGSGAPTHERQRLVLAQLRKNMMMMQMQQPVEGTELQQASVPAGPSGLAGTGAPSIPPLPTLQPQQQPPRPFSAQQLSLPLPQPQQAFPAQAPLQQQASLQPQASLRQQGSLQPAGFRREEALSLPLSPTASMGVNGHAHARKRPALAAQMGAAVKEAAAYKPGGGGGAESELRRGHPLNRCLLVLERLLQHEGAGPFATPVDPEALGIPDYPQVITRPMDLGTVRDRLAPGRTEGWGMVAYKSIDEVLADVQLVWTNCRRYNAAGSPINEMCDAVEAAFCQLWEQAGLGTAASAKALPLPAAPTRSPGSHQAAAARSQQGASASKAQRSKQASSGHKQSSHSRQHSHGKQQGLSHGKQPRVSHQGQSPKASAAAGKAGGRKRATASGAGGGNKRQHVSPPAAEPQQVVAEPQQQQQQPSEEPLLAPPVQQAEEEKEGLELQRLLSSDIRPSAVPAAGPAAAGGAAEVLPASAVSGSASPALWVAGPGPSLEAEGHVPQGAAAARQPGTAGTTAPPPDPFLQRWQAAGSGPFASAHTGQDPRLSRALLHPDRDGGAGSSLPVLVPAQQAAAGTAGPAAAQAQAPPDGLQAMGSAPSGLPSMQLPLLSGIAAATAAVTPDQLQQEQRVLGAWQQVQQQRQLALRAMVAAERANAELARARAEAAEAQAAAEAAASVQPRSPQPQQSGDPAGSGAGSRLAGVRLVPAGRSGDIKALAASIRQSHYLDLMQLGLQLFSKPFTALPLNTPRPAPRNGTSAASTAAQNSPMLACAVQCVTSCLEGKGTADALAGGRSAVDDAALAVKQEQTAPSSAS